MNLKICSIDLPGNAPGLVRLETKLGRYICTLLFIAPKVNCIAKSCLREYYDTIPFLADYPQNGLQHIKVSPHASP